MYKILLATDGSEHSKKAAQEVLKMAESVKTAVTALLVFTVEGLKLPLWARSSGLPLEEMAKIEMEYKAKGQEILDSIKEMFSAKGIEIETLIEKGNPGDVICKVAQDGNFNLVVLGSRGMGEIKGLVLGSVSNKVVHCAETKTNVMVVK